LQARFALNVSSLKALKGRSGNSMFAYASSRGLSAYYNTDSSGIFEQRDCAAALGNPSPFATFTKEHFGYHDEQKARSTISFSDTQFNQAVLALDKPTNLDSFLQVHWYFCNIEQQLLEELRWFFLVCLQGGAVLLEAFSQLPPTVKARVGTKARVAKVGGDVREGVMWTGEYLDGSNATAGVTTGEYVPSK
jgi:hypothetical protein